MPQPSDDGFVPKPDDKRRVIIGLTLAVVGVVIVAAVGAYLTLAAPPIPWLTHCGLSGGGGPNLKPMVSLTASPIGSAEYVQVVSIGFGAPWPSFCHLVNMGFNDTYGEAVRLPGGPNATVTVSIAGTPPSANGRFVVHWTDPNGDGNLEANDSFTISQSSGSLRPGSYTFYLVWSDGSTVAWAPFQRS